VASELLAMQAPQGVPRSNFFEVVTDPLLPPQRTQEMLAHLYDEVYDLSAESHLSRLLKVILGDTGTGQLRKRYTYAHLSHYLLTIHYNDLDQLYAEVLGLKRLIRERLVIDPYLEAATAEEWEAINAADAAYRARVEAFSHSLTMAGTPSGMVLAATAVLGEECRVYESYSFLDDAEAYADVVEATTNTYGDLEEFTYGDLNGSTYAELEGHSGFTGRLPGSRGEFIVRPLRPVTAEERRALVMALNRLKPAEALMTIDARPGTVHTQVPVARAYAASSYWHIRQQVQVAPEHAVFYDRADENQPVEQPRPAFSAYQGEAWSYSADVVTVEASLEDAEGNVVQDINHERLDTGQTTVDYLPERALTSPADILLGRYVSDGVLSAPPAVRGSY
jgi:hypothetical protein